MMAGYGYNYGAQSNQNSPYGYNNSNAAGGGGGGAGGGGGFLTGGGDFPSSSPSDSPGGKRSGASNQSLRPVTVKQLLESSQAHGDAPFKIDELEITQVTLIGIIRSMQEQSTNVAYVIEDGTGIIDVRQWFVPDSAAAANGGRNDFAAQRRAECCTETYVRVIGQLRAFQGKRHVVAYSIRPIKNFNEVTFHFLECISAHLFVTRGPPASAQQPAAGYGQFGQGNMTAPPTANYGMQPLAGAGSYGQQPADVIGGGGGGGFGGDFTPVQQQVLQAVKVASHTTEGIHVNQVVRQLGSSYGQGAVNQALEWLISEGHLYSTIDEFHVRCCNP